VVHATRCRLSQLAILAIGAILLTSHQICGQGISVLPPAGDPLHLSQPERPKADKTESGDAAPGVIHADLVEAEPHEEPNHETDRFWCRADYWLAWIKGVTFPVLATQGAAADPLPGALGQEGTQFRFGGGEPPPHARQGARFDFGGWLDCDECLGVELGGFFLASRTVGANVASPGTPVLARPFFNVDTMQQDSSIVTYPNVATGAIGIQSGTSLWGADANMVWTVNSSKDYPVRLLAGIRYLELHDDLTINEAVQVLPSSPVFPGQAIAVHDNFSCDNEFYGGNLGFSASYNLRQLELQATAQCALGLCQEYVAVLGSTHIGNQSFPAGLLAVSSNSGGHVRDVFAVVPEVDLDARYEVTRHIVVSLGYEFLYWSQVARAGQQVDTNVNPNLVPTSNTYGLPATSQQPRLSIHDTDFWVQGVHLGLELRF
jgi:Putative beta barrel porin-7 (BBP7)